MSQGALGVPDAPEPYFTFGENALAKARHARRHTGLPALADDSGLCVPALSGAPGVLSARYATQFGLEKSDANNNACLLQQLQGVTDRRAFFVCAMVWVAHENDPVPLIAQHIWLGEVLEQPQGEQGFGYDPLFWVPSRQCTAAQMPAAQKNQLSHRAQATHALLSGLQLRLGWPDRVVEQG